MVVKEIVSVKTADFLNGWGSAGLSKNCHVEWLYASGTHLWLINDGIGSSDYNNSVELKYRICVCVVLCLCECLRLWTNWRINIMSLETTPLCTFEFPVINYVPFVTARTSAVGMTSATYPFKAWNKFISYLEEKTLHVITKTGRLFG